MAKNILSILLLLATLPGFAQKAKITVTPIDHTFYVHTSYLVSGDERIPANGLIVDTPQGILLIDTPWDMPQTKQLLRWIRKHLKKKVFLCIISHAHKDRMGGISVLQKQKIDVVSTKATALRAVQLGFPAPSAVPGNDFSFGTGMVDTLKVRWFFPGAGHTPDNIVVWFPYQKVLFGGCLVKSLDAKTVGNIEDADLKAWPETIRSLQEMFPDVRLIIPGHYSSGGRELLDHTLELLDAYAKTKREGN